MCNLVSLNLYLLSKLIRNKISSHDSFIYAKYNNPSFTYLFFYFLFNNFNQKSQSLFTYIQYKQDEFSQKNTKKKRSNMTNLKLSYSTANMIYLLNIIHQKIHDIIVLPLKIFFFTL